MPRLQPVDPKTATGKAKELLDAVKQKMGKVPNILATMAQAPAVLEGYLGLSGALKGGSLSPQLGEKIALAVGEQNNCCYCLSAHSVIGKMSGLTEEQITQARQGKAGDAKEQAAVTFALQMIEKRGQVNDDDVAAVKSAGYTDGEVAEIVGAVALNVLTNYFNHVADTEIDFPKVSALCNKGGCCGGH